MSKIYIVKSSSGSYEDYRAWNEKAFTDKHKAEEYACMLNKVHEHKPEFITKDFQSNYNECYDNLPDWEDFPEPITDDNRSEYTKWEDNNIEKDREIIIDEMYKRGFFLTKNMIELYERWENSQYEDYHKCTVEELELV